MISSRAAPDHPEPVSNRAERLAFTASVIFLLVAPFAASGGIRATCLIVAALAIALSGSWNGIRGAPRAVKAAIALTCAWFALGVASLAWTVDARHTLEELRAESLYGALAFGVFLVLANDAQRWRRWWVAIIAGTLLAFIAKILHADLGLVLWRHSPDAGPGAFSTHLVLVAPLLLVLIRPPPWGFGRSAWILAIAVSTLFAAAWSTREAWTTPNRIVWPSLGIVFLMTLAATHRSVDKGVRVQGLRALTLFGALVMATAFAASIAAKNERYYPNQPGFVPSVEQDLRPRLWSLGLEQWKSAPVLGHGFGREILASVFLPETPVGVDHPPLRHAHNALVNIALQVGAVGLFLFVLVLLAFARNYAAMLATPQLAVLGVIGLALIAGFVTKNVTDDFLHRHNAQMFWALNGMLLGFASRVRPA